MWHLTTNRGRSTSGIGLLTIVGPQQSSARGMRVMDAAVPVLFALAGVTVIVLFGRDARGERRAAARTGTGAIGSHSAVGRGLPLGRGNLDNRAVAGAAA
jgi:hypothetical protein